MCDRLNHAEKRKVRPDLEGELPDMPVLEVDEDFEQENGKKGAKGKADTKMTEEMEEKKKQVNNLYAKFGLGDVLKGIEEAENKDNFDKMIEFSSKLQFLF